MSGTHTKGKKRGPQKAWTQDEDAYLRDSAGRALAKDIAAALGVSKMQVQVRCNTLGLQWRVKGGMKAAKHAGEKFFASVLPCKRGHVGLRRASSGQCVECEKATAHEKAIYKQHYKARKRAATPGVLSIQEKRLIWNTYKEARRLTIETGVRHEVDHVMPLARGGLHVSSNLQVITGKANREKSCKLPYAPQEELR